jgi:hypothetical protein
MPVVSRVNRESSEEKGMPSGYTPHLKTAASGEEMHGQRRVKVLLLLLENLELFGLQLSRLGIGRYSVKQLCVELPRQAFLRRTESWHQTSEI